MEYMAKFSTDGRHLAFTASYEGNEDVYVMPVEGGEPRRLTHHGDRDLVVDWTPDGSAILFRSHRQSGMSSANRLFRVSPDGGFPQVLPLPAGELASYSPDGKQLAYNRIAREFRTWKRYQGGMAQDIWLYDFAGNQIERLTDFPGTDAFPMWQGERIFFVSDRGDGMVMNLFVHDLTDRSQKQLTRFDTYDVKWPSQGPGAIVFENGGELYRYDLVKGDAEKLAFRVEGDFPDLRPQYRSVSGFVHRAVLAEDGKQVVVEARGDLFLHAAEGDKPVRNLTRSPGVRESYPALDASGKRVAYFSDETGEHELCVLSLVDGQVRQITRGGACYRARPVWSPDGQKILFGDAMVRLWVADLASGAVTEVARGEFARATNFIEGVWSPDSAWIAFAKPEASHLYAIYLYELRTGKSTRVTDAAGDSRDPRFSADGRHLFFVANRQMGSTWGSFDVTQLVTDKPGRLAGITLQAGAAAPRVGTESSPDVLKGPMRVDLAGIEERLFPLAVQDGYYVGLRMAKGKLFYVKAGSTDTSPDAFPDDPRVGPLCCFDPLTGKETELLEGVDEFGISACGGFALVRQGRGWSRLEVAGKGLKSLKLEAQMMVVDPRAEWKQIFNEAWMQFRDWFYDPNFHGVNWGAMKERYGRLLPYAAHRDDLNYLLGEMIAELSCSHTAAAETARLFPVSAEGFWAVTTALMRPAADIRLPPFLVVGAGAARKSVPWPIRDSGSKTGTTCSRSTDRSSRPP
jgi:tricorn protease